MSTALAFSWDKTGVRFVAGELRGNQVRLTAAEAVPFDDTIDEGDGASVGQFLRRALDARRIRPETVIGCADREDVILHQASFPSVPLVELGKMIHFQATVEFALADEESTYDYLLDRPSATGGHRALVVLVPTKRLQCIRGAAAALGARLGGIRMQSTARLAARRHWSNDHGYAEDKIEVLLALSGGTIEAIGSRCGQLLFSQLTPISHDESEPLSAARVAVRRLRAHLVSQSLPLSAERLVVLSAADDDWPRKLEMPAGGSVEVCDPFQGLPQPPERAWGELATLAGALAEEAERSNTSIDFSNPRRPAGPHPLRRYRRALVSGAVVIACVAIALQMSRVFRASHSRYEHWRRQDRAMTAELKRLRPVRSQRDAVADWLDQRVHWLNAYEDLLRKLPDASKLYLTAISFSETGSSSRPGAIHLEGYADSRSTVASIAMRLAEDGRYRLQPIALHAASRDPNYPQAFEADLTLLRAEETEIGGPSPAIRDSASVSGVAPDVRTGAPDLVHRIVRRK